jgi:hypothetical protein
MAAASTSRGPAGPGAGSGGARSAGGLSCSGRRRGSRRGSTSCGDRHRSCHRSQGRRRSCSFGNPFRKRSDRRTGLPQPASQAPSLLSFACRSGVTIGTGRRGGCGARLGWRRRSLGAKNSSEYRRGVPVIQEGDRGLRRKFAGNVPISVIVHGTRASALVQTRRCRPAGREVERERAKLVGEGTQPALGVDVHGR